MQLKSILKGTLLDFRRGYKLQRALYEMCMLATFDKKMTKMLRKNLVIGNKGIESFL